MKNVYVVTGAGSGMGFEIAKLFGQQGIIVLCGRTLEKIEKAVAALKVLGIDAHGIPCDVSNRDAVHALAHAAAQLGNIRAVVNAAGVSPNQVGGSGKTVYNINLAGTVHVAESFFPMINEGGVLINISSMAGHMMPMNETLEKLFAMENLNEMIEAALAAFPESHAYSISKRFVIEYTKRLGVQFAAKKARVVSISPGTFDTPLLASVKESDSTKAILKNTPMGRVGDPVEIAYLAEFLASDKAGFITGTDVLIDGGYFNVMTQERKQQKKQ